MKTAPLSRCCFQTAYKTVQKKLVSHEEIVKRRLVIPSSR